ncbi:MAG: triose-phosphate isomerase [Acidobacteria bacterium]|nr:triose-phosphate isomerase [Acidobacteriota bacterium]
MRKPLIVANWKMNKTVAEAESFIAQFLSLLPSELKDIEVAIAPPFTALHPLAKRLEGSGIKLAAQNVFYEEKGAFTGEISPKMLAELGCSYVIVGHSERRRYFGETDEMVNRKVRAALSCSLTPIICIGETLEERENEKTMEVVGSGLSEALKGVELEDPLSVVIAYEPIWAIGTGHTATPDQANEVHEFIRKKLMEGFGEKIGEGIRIIYGGSVNAVNVSNLFKEREIDGALVGGASLKPDSFATIIRLSPKE